MPIFHILVIFYETFKAHGNLGSKLEFKYSSSSLFGLYSWKLVTLNVKIKFPLIFSLSAIVVTSYIVKSTRQPWFASVFFYSRSRWLRSGTATPCPAPGWARSWPAASPCSQSRSSRCQRWVESGNSIYQAYKGLWLRLTVSAHIRKQGCAVNI